MKIKIHPLLCAISMSVMLAACGGGETSSALKNTSDFINNKSSTSSTANSSSGAVDTTSPQKLGKGYGASFIDGGIEVTGDLVNSRLAAGGTAVLTVSVVSSTNNLVTTPVEILFSSDCKEAILKSGTDTTNKVTTTNGSATIDYVANGCVGDVNVYASASINSQVVNAKVVLPISPDTVQSIKFVDSSPEQISLAGTGGVETSLVRFQVLGSTGAPIKDVAVDFTLSNALGGMSLTKNTQTTDKNGYASTTVQAGNIHTTVRVTATAKLAEIFTTSSQLIVSTGIPDQDSISLAASNTHPVSWEIDGVESNLTIRLADAFNNPPPPNTNVAFRTEGGSITDGCLTDTKGNCSVVWASQNPRPARSGVATADRKLCVDSNGDPVADYLTCRLERAGRVTILATAIGNESFVDANGNGIFDDEPFTDSNGNGYFDRGENFVDANKNGIYDSGESFVDTNQDGIYDQGEDFIDTNKNGTYDLDLFSVARVTNDCKRNRQVPSLAISPTPCDDLPEAYLDKNENGTRDNNEEFVDFTSILDGLEDLEKKEGVPDGQYTTGNNKYNGILCPVEGPTCTKNQVTIRQSITLVMTSRFVLTIGGSLPFIDTSLNVGLKPTKASTRFLLADSNGHGAGAGTTLTLDTANLQNASATITQPGPILASDDPQWIEFTVTATSATEAPTGTVKIQIKTPSTAGDVTFNQIISVN